MAVHYRTIPLVLATILATGCTQREPDMSGIATNGAKPVVVDDVTPEATIPDSATASVEDTLVRFLPPGPTVQPLPADVSTSGARVQSMLPPRKGGFTPIEAGGPGCRAPTKEMMATYDKYGAQHFCFSYALDASSTWHTVVTDAVYKAIGLVIPVLDLIDLYQPNQNVVRFQVKNEANYRLFTYWTRNVSNLPPPGKYTDHKFINPMDRSIDYYIKVRKHSGHTVRIAGVAEVVFVPQELCDLARREGFLAGGGTARPCPTPATAASH